MLTNSEMLIMHLACSADGNWRDKDAVASIANKAKLDRDKTKYHIYRLAKSGYVTHNGRRGPGNKATYILATKAGYEAYQIGLNHGWKPPPWMIRESLHWVKVEILHHIGLDQTRGWRDPEDAILHLAVELGIPRRTIQSHFNQLKADGLVGHNGRTVKYGTPTLIFATGKGLAVRDKEEDWPVLKRKKNSKRKRAATEQTPPKLQGKTRRDVAKAQTATVAPEGDEQASDTTQEELNATIEVTSTEPAAKAVTESIPAEDPPSAEEDPSEAEPLPDAGDGLRNTPPDDEEDRSEVRLGSIETRIELLIELLKLYNGEWATPDLPALNTAAKALGVDATHLLPAVKQAVFQAKIFDNGKGALRATAYWLPEANVHQLPPPIPYGHKPPKNKHKESPVSPPQEPAKTAKRTSSPTYDQTPAGRVLWSLRIAGVGARLSELTAMVNGSDNAPPLSRDDVCAALNYLKEKGFAELHYRMPSGNHQWKPLR